MFILVRGFILSIAMVMLSFPGYAEEASKEQIKSLDEQVQEVKAETLNLGTQIRLLEEKLLYPSGTQVAVFVSLDTGEAFRLDSIEIQLDGNPVAEHLYTLRELEALQKGGVQRIYVGNVSSGKHDLEVSARGKIKNGTIRSRKESFRFSKDEGPKMLEVRLFDSETHMITLRDW
jgi:hypothetical protein